MKRRIEVQGHRGARALLPENTLAGFKYAVELGVDTVELDLGASKDNRLVVAHDQFVNPVICLAPGGKRMPRPIPVRVLTLAQLKGFDCGTLQHPRFPQQRAVPGERMPTLSEVFEMVAKLKHPNGRSVRFNIETKSVPGRPDLSPPPEKFAELFVAVLRKHGMLGRVNVQSFDYRTLQAVRRLEPTLPIALLTARATTDYAALAKGCRAEIISPHHEWITAEDVRNIHAAGARVIPYTANKFEEWSRLLEMGVDGIITDNPAGLIAYLTGRGLR